MSDDATAQTVLEFYGSSIPEGVGRPAYYRHQGTPRNDYPKTVVDCRAVSGNSFTGEKLQIHSVSKRDGLLVVISDSDETQYYTIPEDVVEPCVTRLLKDTKYVLRDGDDEYLPPLVTDDSDDSDDDDDNDDIGDCQLDNASMIGNSDVKWVRDDGLRFGVTD